MKKIVSYGERLDLTKKYQGTESVKTACLIIINHRKKLLFVRHIDFYLLTASNRLV